MPKLGGEGRRRLTLVLCGLSGAACAAAMALVLLLYGMPFDPTWWWVMAAILAASFVLPRAFVPVAEWVIDGYRQQGTD
ncbi:MAG: hypothetical protein MI920_03480 [Kiloniellales bacterium]|nr:hypothetical protein [Kiloniellales bacterium]